MSKYKLHDNIKKYIDFEAWIDNQQLILHILNNMWSLPENQIVGLCNFIGGSSELGKDLYKAIQEIFPNRIRVNDNKKEEEYIDPLVCDLFHNCANSRTPCNGIPRYI